MNANERREFINELIASTAAGILEQVDKMPDDWNGIELREYIAERFSRNRWAMDKRRRRDFDNAILTCNL